MSAGSQGRMAKTMPCKLIIFDCDGVLVDSEPLSAAVACEMLADLGFHLELAEALDRFNGRKVAHWLADLEDLIGHPVGDGFIPEFRRRSAAKFRAELTPVEGIRDLLEGLSTPYCLASSGPLSKIELTLSLTGLGHFFEGRIFSGYELGSWKPDPDLFLHAAKTFSTAPGDCVVIEDSLAGIQAGLAAGMRVMHYLPEPLADMVPRPGVVTFRAMQQLPYLLGI